MSFLCGTHQCNPLILYFPTAKRGFCVDPTVAVDANAAERELNGACSAYPEGLPKRLAKLPEWVGICNLGLRCCKNNEKERICEGKLFMSQSNQES